MKRKGRFPTVREIEAGTGIARPTVQRYLTAMRESGEIEYNGIRGVRTMAMSKARRETAAVGMVGVVACGSNDIGWAGNTVKHWSHSRSTVCSVTVYGI